MGQRKRNRNRYVRYALGYLVGLLIVVLATTSTAQVPIFPTPTPRPTRTPGPTPTTPPSPGPSATPTPTGTGNILPTPSEEPEETERPPASLFPSPTPSALSDDLPPELEQPTLVVPNIPRTRARNTARLVDLLEPLTEYGLSLDQVLVEGMGRFPVAGVAYYRDDWLHPRYNPTPHLHKGLDIFADFGTPIRAPDKGVVTRMTDNPLSGGIGVWTRGSDGTSYYFAHLAERVEGLRIGQRVNVGTVLGFVGDTGNAQGGTPHLHFEIHRGGPIPPKPTVDRWLDEAIDLAPRWVEARKREIDNKRNVLGGSGAVGRPQTDLDASMLLTLLDPVGGSVGMLPHLQLAPAQRGRLGSGLLLELIRLRSDGYLFVPATSGVHLRD